LSQLSPSDQASLICGRVTHIIPGAEELEKRLANSVQSSSPLRVKFGIDPTGADVHLGHSVPMRIARRFQRMWHRVQFVVGDVTAKIGDPSGRSKERPRLTDDDIRRNLATYRAQVSPFFDFTNADFRFNSEWLSDLRLPILLELLAQVPLSLSLQ